MSKQIKLANLNTCIKESNRVVMEFCSKQVVSNSDIFSLGAQLLYFGQRLTEISEYKLTPGSQEAKDILAQITHNIQIIEPTTSPLITKG